MVVWASTALQDSQVQYSTVQYSTQYSTNSQVPHDIDISHTKEWVVSIFMVGAALVPWCASETLSDS